MKKDVLLAKIQKIQSNCLFLLICIFIVHFVQSQSVGISDVLITPDPSSMLEIRATNKGLLIPRVELISTNNPSPVSSPATSLLVFNTATQNDVTPGFYYWDGTQWIRLATGSLSGGITSLSAGTSGAETGTSGLTFSVNPITSAGSIALANSGVTAGTYGQTGANVAYFTVDARGRLTSAANRTLTPADIGAAHATHSHATLTPGTGISGSAYDGSTPQTWNINFGAVSGLANANSNGISNQVARADHQHKRDVRVAMNGTDVGIRNRLNFISGTNITLNITDDAANDEIDIIINSTGGASNAWLITGNNGLIDATHFLGTTDNVPLNFRVNNIRSGRIHPDTTHGATFFGFRAGLNTASTAHRNTFIGCQAGASNTSGEYNTAVGYYAMRLNTTGYWNTAVGQQALRNNSSGHRNTALGMEALIYNTTGSYNTSVGTFSLYSNYTGNNNTAVGYYALYGTTASHNTAVGFEAGQYITTGTNNVAIGYQAGVPNGSGNLSNTIAIGSGVQCTASNQIRIGNTSISTVFIPGINGTTTSNAPNVYIDPITGQLMRSTSAGGGNFWSLTGNSGTTPGTNFLGTTDNNGLLFRVNNRDAYFIRSHSSWQKGHLFLGYEATYDNTWLADFEFRTASASTLMITGFYDYSWEDENNFIGPILKFGRSQRSGVGSGGNVNPNRCIGMIAFSAPQTTTGMFWPELYQALIVAMKRGNTATDRAADLRFYTVSASETGGITQFERMRIGQAGGVGIHINNGGGNNDPRARLHVYGGVAIGPASGNAINATIGNNNSIQISTETYFGGQHDDHTGFLIYSIMPGGWGTGELRFACATDWSSYNTTTPALRITQTAGYINGAIIQTSDLRSKTNIRTMKYGLNEILKLKPVYYTKHVIKEWQDGKPVFSELEGHQWNEAGFIAQDVYDVIPEIVHKPSSDEEQWGLNYIGLIPILVKAIQEQQKIIEQQQQTIDQIHRDHQQQINVLRAEIEQLKSAYGIK